jgi:hypothetical protein
MKYSCRLLQLYFYGESYRGLMEQHSLGMGLLISVEGTPINRVIIIFSTHSINNNKQFELRFPHFVLSSSSG